MFRPALRASPTGPERLRFAPSPRCRRCGLQELALRGVASIGSSGRACARPAFKTREPRLASTGESVARRRRMAARREALSLTGRWPSRPPVRRSAVLASIRAPAPGWLPYHPAGASIAPRPGADPPPLSHGGNDGASTRHGRVSTAGDAARDRTWAIPGCRIPPWRRSRRPAATPPGVPMRLSGCTSCCSTICGGSPSRRRRSRNASSSSSGCSRSESASSSLSRSGRACGWFFVRAIRMTFARRCGD